MAAQQNRGRADDAIFLADMFLAQTKAKQAKDKATSAKGNKCNVRWVERDAKGRPLLKRSRSGETRKRASATVVSVVGSEDVTPFESSEEVPTVTQSNCSQHLFDIEMQKLQDVLTSADVQGTNKSPSTSTSWCLRQSVAQDEWRKARSFHINCLLFCNVAPEKNCSHCTSPAVIRCRDCMPQEWLCMDCDTHIHKKLTLHNRESCIEGIYKPIEPTVCCVKKDGKYTLVNQVDVFSTFEEMKTVAPGLSRQGFLRMLERRTCLFGRAGKIHGDVFQRSFMEYTFCQYQCEEMASVEHFTCPACTPNMLALCADGNRKVYRFRQSKGSEEPYFDGTFIAKDTDVHHFVDEIRSKMKSTAGKGICGASQWSAARETARKASKLDEEGLEVVVCRHGVLLKALNMYRGGIFAYPLYLQKDLQAATNGQFYCTDIACKYWPYLEKFGSLHVGTQTFTADETIPFCHACQGSFNQTLKKAEAESQRLESLSSELGCPENVVHQWVDDVRQWATDDETSQLLGHLPRHEQQQLDCATSESKKHKDTAAEKRRGIWLVGLHPP
ncbi:hypothetical protein F2P79_025558 [Pimephales promelas]|nr:hypothetical protein F2P79_025558 [Pimephales promelas]